MAAPGIWLAALFLLAYAAILAAHVGARAGGSDSSGYLNNARLLAAGRVQAPDRELRGYPLDQAPGYLYVPLGFRPAPRSPGIVPTYATGLPLMIVAASPWAGWRHACDVVMIAHALLGILLAYGLGRWAGLSPAWSALGAGLLAVSPLYVQYSLQAMSDLPAMVWVAGAVLAAAKSARSDSRAWAAAAGFVFGGAVLIRPTDLLGLLPVGLALGASPRRWAWFVSGGSPLAVFLGCYNAAAYGHALTTGYGDIRTSFSVHFVPVTVRHYARWLPLLFTPVIGLMVLLPAAAGRDRRPALLLGAWAALYLGFYAFYYNTHETWWYLRFLLPAAPAFAVGGLLGARCAWRRWRGGVVPRCALPILAVLILANALGWNHRLKTLSVGRGEADYSVTAAWLEQHLPSNAVIASMQMSGALYYYTPFVLVRWDQLNSDSFARVARAARGEGRPLYAVLYPFEIEDALAKCMPGKWTKIDSIREATVWRYD